MVGGGSLRRAKADACGCSLYHIQLPTLGLLQKGHLGRKGRDNLAQLRAQPDQGEDPPAQFQEGRNQTWLGGGDQVMEVLGGTPLDQPGEWDQAGL